MMWPCRDGHSHPTMESAIMCKGHDYKAKSYADGLRDGREQGLRDAFTFVYRNLHEPVRSEAIKQAIHALSEQE